MGSDTIRAVPGVVVTVADANGLGGSDTVTLDVDLNNNGSFSGGELGYATGTLHDGQVVITLPTLSSTGSYPVRARVTDAAGNQTTTGSQTITVTSSGSATITHTQVADSDPL